MQYGVRIYLLSKISAQCQAFSPSVPEPEVLLGLVQFLLDKSERTPHHPPSVS